MAKDLKSEEVKSESKAGVCNAAKSLKSEGVKPESKVAASDPKANVGACEIDKDLVGIAQNELPLFEATSSQKTDSKSESSSTNSGSTSSIKRKASPTQVGERPNQGISKAIEDLQPHIQGKAVQADFITKPSKTVSFLIGFAGTLLTVFSILRVRS